MFTLNKKQKQVLLNLVKKIKKSARNVICETILYVPVDEYTVRFAFTENLEKSVYVEFFNVMHNDPIDSIFTMSIQALKVKDAFSFSVWQDKTTAHSSSGAETNFDVVSIEFYPIIPIYPFEVQGKVLISKQVIDMAMQVKSQLYYHYIFSEKAQALLTSIIAARTFGEFEDEVSAISKEDVKIAYEFENSVKFKIYETLVLLSVGDIAEYKIVWQIPKIKFDKKVLLSIMFAFEEKNIAVNIEPIAIKSLTDIDKNASYVYYFCNEENCFKHGLVGNFNGKLISSIKARSNSNPTTDVGFAIDNEIIRKLLLAGAVRIDFSDKAFKIGNLGLKYATSPISFKTIHEQVIVAPVAIGK